MVSPYVFPGLDKKANIRMNKDINVIDHNTIIGVIAEYSEISVPMLIGKSRLMNIVEARQIAISLVQHSNPDFTLEYLGSIFGNRHHSTIIYSLNTFENLLTTDKEFRRKVSNIKSLLQ